MMDMKSASPFAALNKREQKERWICWQSQKMPQEKESVLALQKPTPSKTENKSVSESAKPIEGRYMPHHSQYTSVVQRMQQAQRQARHYTNC